MRIEKREVIFLSQDEVDTWVNFIQILDELRRECENPDTKNLVCEIQSLLDDLADEVEED